MRSDKLQHKHHTEEQKQRLERRLELDEQAYQLAQDKEMEIAATKIQSLHRGRAARRKLADQHETERRQFEEEYAQAESATKIQAAFRGRKGRKQVTKLRVEKDLARIHGFRAVQARPTPHIKRTPEATQAARAAIEQALSGAANPDGFTKAPPAAVLTSKVAVLPLPPPPPKARASAVPGAPKATKAELPLHKQAIAEALPLPGRPKPPLPMSSPSGRRSLPMMGLASEQREKSKSPSPKKAAALPALPVPTATTLPAATKSTPPLPVKAKGKPKPPLPVKAKGKPTPPLPPGRS